MNGHLQSIGRFIDARHKRRLAGMVLRRLWSLALVFMAVTAVLHLLFALFPWTIVPLVWDGAAVLFIAGGMAIIVDQLLIRRPGRLSTARLLERRSGVNIAHPLLSIATELAEAAEKNEFHDEVFHLAAGQIGAYRNVTVADREKWRLPVTATLLLLVIGSLMLRPLLLSYWQLPLMLFKGSEVSVFPGTVRVPRHASVTLRLVPKQPSAPSCQLVMADLQRGKQAVRWLRPDGRGAFSLRIDSCASSFAYRFIFGGARCLPETVTVVPPPLLHRLQIELRPPLYTRLPSRHLPEGQGDFIAYGGTHAQFSIESSPLRAAALRYNGDTVALRVSGAKAEGELVVNNSASYSFSLLDTFSQLSDSLTQFSIGVLPDEAPAVRFLRPNANKNLEPAQRESLLVEASDDLGVRSVTLYWCKNAVGDAVPSSQDLSPARPARLWQKTFLWKIFRLSLYPGDTLFYWARARDTRSYGGAQYATTDTFWFRIPTIEEIHRTMAQRDANARESIVRVRRRQDELMKNVEQLDKATAGSEESSPSWDRRQLAQTIEQAMKAQADSLQEALRQIEENVKELREEGALGEEIARKMDEVRKALEELIALYGDSLLFPQYESGEISISDMREAVDKLKEMLPDLNSRLDNTLQFLEALRRDRELAQLAMRAEKLAEEQAQLARSGRDDQTAPRQKDLLDRIGQLQKEIRAGGRDDQEPPDGQSMHQLDSLGNTMEEQLSRRQTPSPGTMQQMSGNLASLAQELREKMSSFMMEQLEALRNKLLDLVSGSLNLSSWQEQVRTDKPAGEEARRQQARAQQALHQALGFLGQEIDSLPLLPPSLRQRLRGDAASAREASKAAVQSLGEGDDGFGMRVSEQSIKQLAASLLETVSAMSQEGGSCNSGAGGWRESLRKMSGKQAAINAATAQLLRAMLQGRPPGGAAEGSEGCEAARREAQAAQQALADQLKALGEKFGDATGEGMKKRVEELEKEARNLTQLLNLPREEVTERQDRFLARMLQSALSLHREEEGKEERKSTSAGIVFTKSTGTPSDSAFGNNDTFYMLRRRALQEGTYPASYRQSINAYFDSLGVLYLK
ncbi:MAG: hypothetical protein JW913_07270 [Chitinispirillaceae bacterium]|nr:hypothetical protein [Chitinispirillaceae bacterium]